MISWILKSNWKRTRRGSVLKKKLQVNQILMLLLESFEKALVKMEKINRSSKLTVLQAIEHYPQIVQKVAYTVPALPPTQVSVERLFSALRLTRSDLRASMKEDLIEAILFLRSSYLH